MIADKTPHNTIISGKGFLCLRRQIKYLVWLEQKKPTTPSLPSFAAKTFRHEWFIFKKPFFALTFTGNLGTRKKKIFSAPSAAASLRKLSAATVTSWLRRCYLNWPLMSSCQDVSSHFHALLGRSPPPPLKRKKFELVPNQNANIRYA